MRYDPSVGPDPERWLAAPEARRLAAVQHYHDRTEQRAEGAATHAAIHVAVETQLAGGHSAARGAFTRLLNEGLDRHEAIHAIGSIVAGEIFNMLKTKRAYAPEAYARKLGALTAASWRSGWPEE